jgi:hypothetical protein
MARFVFHFVRPASGNKITITESKNLAGVSIRIIVAKSTAAQINELTPTSIYYEHLCSRASIHK